MKHTTVLSAALVAVLQNILLIKRMQYWLGTDERKGAKMQSTTSQVKAETSETKEQRIIFKPIGRCGDVGRVDPDKYPIFGGLVWERIIAEEDEND